MDLDDVKTMRDVRVRAEDSAWMTCGAYMDAARHGHGLSRSDRANQYRRGRDYRRRAIAVSQYLNRKGA